MHDKVMIGDATLYLGDCAEILPLLPACDLMLTDPPYGVGADKAAFQNARKRGSAATASRDYGAGTWDNEPPPVWLVELMRAKSKHQILWGGNYYNLPPAVGWLVWDKENGDNGYADCELAWSNLPQAIRRIKYRWAGMLQQDMANKEVREHPTQKPVPVMRWALLQAQAAQTVCDPFMGSGTTGVACALEGRKFIGIEREPRYFEIACRRIDEAQRQVPLIAPEPQAVPEQQGFEL